MIHEIVKVVKHHFPDFYNRLKEVQDPRKQAHYEIEEIIFAAIAMFLFKTGSLNNFDNFRKTGKFKRNYQKSFGLRLPSLDAVSDVLQSMPEVEFENLKTEMIKTLLEKRVLHKYRFQGKFLIAADGTGIATYKEKHCPDCLYTESKTGKKTYYHKVLEAKIVASNGFSISICTIWIDNEDTNNGKYDKQGCERKAFVKLAEKLKKDFPGLPICLCVDGLYPNNTFFEICEKNNWDYIVTLKDGNLKGLWNKIRLVNRECRKYEYKIKNTSYKQDLQWINAIKHNGYIHNWLQCKETVITTKETEKFRFVYLTNMNINYQNCVELCNSGRLRWKIEKQGFDQQKNHGYNIEHKYCRKSYTGMKNFYQCCQIAHIINQLVELNKSYKKQKSGKITTTFMWEMMLAFMVFGHIEQSEIERINHHKYQIQYPQ